MYGCCLVGGSSQSTEPSRNAEAEVLIIDEAVPYVVVMAILLVLVIVLIVVVVLLALYALRKSHLQPKSNYTVT